MRRGYLLFSLCLIWNLCQAFPAEQFDFHVPANHISPYASAMGGVNVSDGNDPFVAYSNPGLLYFINKPAVAVSFVSPNKEKRIMSELLTSSNIIHKNELQAICVQARKSSFLYYNLVNTYQDGIDSTNSKKYIDYNLNAIQVGVADSLSVLGVGVNLRYVYGRMVYLSEQKQDSLWIKHEFVDDEAKGISTDLGIAYSKGGFSQGLVFYDLLSKLYWRDNANVFMKKRFAYSLSLGNENITVLTGVQGYLKGTNKSYHLGTRVHLLTWGTPEAQKELTLYEGVYSSDLKEKNESYFSVGTGFVYRSINMIISMTTHGLRSTTGQYLVSFSIGL